MKLVPATALFAICIGWGPLSLAYAQQPVAECLDNNHVTTCVAVLHGAVHATQSLATAATMQPSMKTPATFDADGGALNTESAATASTVATLGLFGSALVILGFFQRKRTVHRQLG